MLATCRKVKMIRKKEFNLIWLVVVISSACGAPVNVKDTDFKATFSNATRWPFLHECISNSSDYDHDDFLCPEYFDAKHNVINCDSDVNDAAIMLTPVETFGNISLFCNVNFTGNVNQNVTIRDEYQHTCEMVCTEGKVKKGKVGKYIKPLCRLISWIRLHCQAQHDSGLKESSHAVIPPKPPKNNSLLTSKTSSPPQLVLVSKNAVDLIETTQSKSNLLNNVTTTGNLSESTEKKTPTATKLNATTPAMDQPMIDEEILSPAAVMKPNDTKPTVPLPSTKKLTVITADTDPETSLKTQNDEPIVVNNSEQTNGDNAEQDEQSKMDDENIYEDTGDNIKEHFGKPHGEYQDLNQIQKKTELEQETTNAVGIDWIAQKSKANSYLLEPEDAGSNFFSYFLFGMFLCIFVYVVYHNKSKILALVLEGRRNSSSRSGSKRKHTAAYRKLDTNLEEAITSSASGRTSQIIY